MERLHSITVLTATFACLLFAAPLLAAQEYCSLSVRVLAPNGRRPEAPVSVTEKNGRTEDKMQDTLQDLQFCDLGILPVTVVVGQKGCEQVVVKDVIISWNKPYTLQVTYDAEKCTEERLPPPKPLCQALFRVVGPDGKWIKGAAVETGKSGTSVLQTDSAGRAFLLVAMNESVRGTVSAPGYLPKEYSFACAEFPGHEENLKLDKK